VQLQVAGQTAAAEDSLRAAVSIDPRSYSAWWNLVMLLPHDSPDRPEALAQLHLTSPDDTAYVRFAERELLAAGLGPP
jgi:hypothetical protein